MSQFRNLIFEGGGVKGIAYVGAMEVLEAEGILDDIVRVGGTSAGAINATLFACGYTNDEQRDIMEELDFNKFMEDSWLIFHDIDRLVSEYGWHKGDFFRSWIGDLISKKMGSQNISFRDLDHADRPSLYVYGSNLSTGYAEVFSVEHTPTMRIVDAIRISMSLPLFFAAIRNPRGDVFVDGGLLKNYPIKLFDRLKYIGESERDSAARSTDYYDAENRKFLVGSNASRSPYVYNRQTLGLRLDSAEEIAAFRYGDVPSSTPIDSFVEYAKALLRTMLNAQEVAHLHSDDWQRTIYIDTIGVRTTNFDLDHKTKEALIEAGRKHTIQYLDWFNNPSDSETPINRID